MIWTYTSRQQGMNTLTRPRSPVLVFRPAGWRSFALIAAVLIVAALVMSLDGPASRADVRALRLQPIEGITELEQFCDPANIRQLVGPPNEGVEDIQSAIFGLAVQIDIANPRKGGMRRVLIGLYSYLEESQTLLPEYIATVQRRLGLSASQVERRQIQPCPQFYSASPTARTSRAHNGLIHITQGIFMSTAEPIVLATVAIIRTEDAISDARPPPPRTTPRKPDSDAGDPKAATRATPPEAKKNPPVVATPATPPAPVPPTPPSATPRHPEGGCDLDCMLDAEKKARAAKEAGGKSDGKTAAATPPKPPAIAVPPVIERPAPKPPGAESPTAAPTDGTTIPPVAKLKRYGAPKYPRLAEPLSIAPAGSGVPVPGASEAPSPEVNARTVFGVESVECSDEGNWILGYFGFLTEKPDGTGQFSIRQRYAINNYPNESVATLADLKRTVKLLECTGGNDCRAPRRTIPYTEFLRTRAPPSTSDKSTVIVPKDKGVEWRCRPEKGVCLSRETDHWRCEAGKDPASSTCIGYDPARWWCVPRREFCYQTVPFGDWGSPHKEGSLVTVRLRPSKDASGQTIEEDHVYDMSHGILSIAQDVLMRRCATHSGAAREWRASWFNQTAN
jgi:hypothetical protein